MKPVALVIVCRVGGGVGGVPRWCKGSEPPRCSKGSRLLCLRELENREAQQGASGTSWVNLGLSLNLSELLLS